MARTRERRRSPSAAPPRRVPEIHATRALHCACAPVAEDQHARGAALRASRADACGRTPSASARPPRSRVPRRRRCARAARARAAAAAGCGSRGLRGGNALAAFELAAVGTWQLRNPHNVPTGVGPSAPRAPTPTPWLEAKRPRRVAVRGGLPHAACLPRRPALPCRWTCPSQTARWWMRAPPSCPPLQRSQLRQQVPQQQPRARRRTAWLTARAARPRRRGAPRRRGGERRRRGSAAALRVGARALGVPRRRTASSGAS